VTRFGFRRRPQAAAPCFKSWCLLSRRNRLREQEAEGVRTHEGVPLVEMALGALITAG